MTAIHGRAYAGIGTTFQTNYETGFDAGTGTGSQFQTNSITTGPTDGTGTLTFGTTSILVTVPGDGTIEAGEECDDGAGNSDTIANACRTDGLLPYCGDGVIDNLFGEQCEPGNLNGISSCTQLGYSGGVLSCSPVTCKYTGCITVTIGGGSGGSGASGSGGGPVGPVGPVTPTHEAAPEDTECGNGTKETGEQCDDGNVNNGDGCDAVCRSEILDVCGNGITETGEQCDDGNVNNGDGCDAVCLIETGVKITFTAYPEKRLPANGNWQNSYNVSILSKTNGQSVFSGNLETNSQGIGTIVVPNISTGNYDIALKGISHLRIIIPDVNINGDTSVDATNRAILAGDVQGDNFVNALDISVVVSHLYSGNTVSDLNRDGIVNALDVSILLNNLYKGGQ
jgi:cysteine-rich repeat protein